MSPCPARAVAERVVRDISDGYVPWKEESFPGLLGNVVAGRIANRPDLHGTNCVVDAACASSLSALHLAALELQARRSDLVLTGGVDTFNDVFMFLCFSKTPALSPTGDARPFDAAARTDVQVVDAAPQTGIGHRSGSVGERAGAVQHNAHTVDARGNGLCVVQREDSIGEPELCCKRPQAVAISTSEDRPAAVRHRGLVVVVPTTVRERVWGHVDDAHDLEGADLHGGPS